MPVNAQLLAHKALYEIHLTTKKSSASISNISGKMFYEWKPSCDAWLSMHRYDMLYEYAEMPSVRVTSDFSTYEAFDGKSFNFNLQRKHDGVLIEEIRGSSDKKQAKYSIPKSLSFQLSEGTLFPTAHTLAVLEKIRAGDKFYNATIFDGSDADGPADISSLILSKAEPYNFDASGANHLDKDLLSTPSWSIRLAFFPLANFEATADYEMSMTFHENGVIRDMIVDYGDFSVTHNLIALEALDDGCLSDINKE